MSLLNISKISHMQISIILAWLILRKEYGLRGCFGGYFGACSRPLRRRCKGVGAGNGDGAGEVVGTVDVELFTKIDVWQT